MKNSKKAFTLVELLVVIAILAVLASVSIIGYTAFTKKAVENNAISELTQVKTLLTGGATADQDGYVVYFLDGTPAASQTAYSFTFKDTENVYQFKAVTLVANDVTPGENEVKLESIDLKLTEETKFAPQLVLNTTNQTVSHTVTNGSNSATAVWNLTTGQIEIQN